MRPIASPLLCLQQRVEREWVILFQLSYFAYNWLRVLDTAERPQIAQGICHQLHPIVSLLDAFKPEQQPLEPTFKG